MVILWGSRWYTCWRLHAYTISERRYILISLIGTLKAKTASIPPQDLLHLSLHQLSVLWEVDGRQSTLGPGLIVGPACFVLGDVAAQ